MTPPDLPPPDLPGLPGPGADQRPDRLRALLDDAVADVEPRSGLDAIRSRTTESPGSARPWYYGAVAAVVATAATITAVAVTSGGPGTTAGGPGFSGGSPAATAPAGTPSAPPPTASATAPATPSPTPEESGGPEPTPSRPPEPSGSAGPAVTSAALPVYYLGQTGQGPRLFREFHSPGDSVPDVLTTAVEQALSLTPDDPDYFSPWPQGTSLARAGFDGETVTLDLEPTDAVGTGLRDRPAGMSEQTAEMAVQQLVHTAQAAAQTSAPVQLTLDGGRTDQLLGVPVAEPLARADSTSTLAQVWITSPVEGSTVPNGFPVEGIGAFYEANVTWELLQGARVMESGFTTAEECCRMAPYSFTVDAPPGEYTLVVRDEDMSGGEGFPPFQDTKRITVTD